MKLRVAFLLALALLAFGASMLARQDMTASSLHSVSYGITRNVDLFTQPCGDSVGGSGFPH